MLGKKAKSLVNKVRLNIQYKVYLCDLTIIVHRKKKCKKKIKIGPNFDS